MLTPGFLPVAQRLFIPKRQGKVAAFRYSHCQLILSDGITQVRYHHSSLRERIWPSFCVSVPCDTSAGFPLIQRKGKMDKVEYITSNLLPYTHLLVDNDSLSALLSADFLRSESGVSSKVCQKPVLACRSKHCCRTYYLCRRGGIILSVLARCKGEVFCVHSIPTRQFSSHKHLAERSVSHTGIGVKSILAAWKEWTLIPASLL
ncbi:hypothetical protein BKA83DRAFT_537761 [Pisolithus microcarpus]|nr:hypothetical protein BKA83DRAFT_537761 [Pisolithus microcarpus]